VLFSKLITNSADISTGSFIIVAMSGFSTLFRRGAPEQGADAVSTAIHGGAAAVKKVTPLHF